MASSEEGDLHMDMSGEEDAASDSAINNNNNATNCGEEEQTNADIKEKLLKMNLGGLPHPLLPLPGGDPRDQLTSVGQTISKLTVNLAKLASPANLQELSLLQATLLSLQQHQLMQFHLLSNIQQKLSDAVRDSDSNNTDGEVPSVKELADSCGIQNPFIMQLSEKTAEAERESREQERELQAEVSESKRPRFDLSPPFPAETRREDKAEAAVSKAEDTITSSIITHHEPLVDKPVNTLELLQQKAQGILNSASKGILANNLADLGTSHYAGSDQQPEVGGGGGQPGNIKHRCKYCGKVFGSDSALSIHIRSHTGERPYKCNVCGNRFTTKGNLKVHFQRHTDRFHHIKMNPNMVPEHLDKFYPALLQQCEEAEKKGLPMPNMSNPTAGWSPVVPPGMTLPTSVAGLPPQNTPSPPAPGLAPSHAPGHAPGLPPALASHKLKLVPSFPLLSSPKQPLTGGALPRYPLPTEPVKKEDIFKDKPSWLKSLPLLERPPIEKSFQNEDAKLDLIKKEFKDERRSESDLVFPQHPIPLARIDALSHKRKISEDLDEQRPKLGSNLSSDDEEFQEEPEDLSSEKDDQDDRANEDLSRELQERFKTGSGFPTSALFPPLGLGPPAGLFKPPASGVGLFSGLAAPEPGPTLPPGLDPTKDPNIYNNLLPRPGSNDNSWESLIEIDKSNELAKLEQLIQTSEGKLSDPNECVLCHRVLSCKSALQMHYRIHTGERPFKCKICNRSFTTKGNLKTHMGVHRSKPPMRQFPQCPVCHKKFTNSVVLQQHIRTHTGEKTDMSLEQIAQAEIRDFPPGVPAPIPFGLPSLRPPGDPLNKFMPQFPLMTSPRAPGLQPLNYEAEEHSSEAADKPSRPSSVASSSASLGSSLAAVPHNYSSSFSASLAALEKQARSMERMCPEESGPAAARPLVMVRPFSREMSPDTRSDAEPQDLSRARSSGDEEEGAGSGAESGEEEADPPQLSRSSPGSSSPLAAPRSPGSPPPRPQLSPGQPLFPGVFPPPGPALGAPLFHPALPFPMPALASLAAAGPPGGPPALLPQFGLPFPALRREYR